MEAEAEVEAEVAGNPPGDSSLANRFTTPALPVSEVWRMPGLGDQPQVRPSLATRNPGLSKSVEYRDPVSVVAL